MAAPHAQTYQPTALADTSSVLVVKHTFFEVVDTMDGAAFLGQCRRISSDPGIFESCEQGEQAEYDADRDGPVEFELAGLSDTETNPADKGLPQMSCCREDGPCLGALQGVPPTGSGATTSTAPSEHGSEEPSQPHDAPVEVRAGGGVGPPSGRSTPGESAASSGHPGTEEAEGEREEPQQAADDESLLSRLVSENARLALENKLLRENARLTMENKMLSKGLSEGNLAFSLWWRRQCETLPEVDGAPPPPAPAAWPAACAAAPGARGGAAGLAGPQQPPQGRRERRLEAVSESLAGVPHGAELDAPAPDARTTVMLRNLPNNYTRAMVLAMLNDEGFAGRYNFLYLPIDFKSRACLGYAFVNLVDAKSTAAFWATFDGFSKWMLPSRKVCTVSWSGPHQGLEAHVERYRNSPVMHPSVPDEYKPVIFEDGLRVVFPAPTKAPRAPRIRNSRDSLA